MIPFPGESAGLDYAMVRAGSPFADFGDGIRYRAGSCTVVAGDVFVAGFFDSRYLESGADAVFSVVVETLAGSSGVLRLSGGPDPDFALEEAPASVHPLGDHTVTGAQTLVVALPWVTVADYLTEDVETAVRVECLSGSVVVQQVKLRIWPPAGAPGGWSASPFVQDAQEKPATITDTGGGVTSEHTNQADMRAEAAALVTSTFSTGTNYVTTGQMLARTTEIGTTVSSGFGAAYISRTPGNYSGPGFEEEAWIVPPNEVRGDDDRIIFQPTGPDGFAWTQGTATLADESEALGPPADGLFHIDATETDTREPAGTLFASFIVGAPLTTHAGVTGLTYSDVTLPEFDATYLRVTIWHAGQFSDVAETGGSQVRLANGTTTDEAEFDHLRYLWTPAPYRYWNPTTTRIIPLRQLHRDDGLGVTPPRAFGGASRIRTGRAYGYD